MTPNSVWPSPLVFSLVGPGKVGSSLAHWAISKGGSLKQVAARRTRSANALTSALGGRPTNVNELSTHGEDLLLIAVSDSAIQPVSETLANRRQARVVLHTSGRIDASALSALREQGSKVGTLHPLMAFPKVSSAVTDAKSVIFGIDGDAEAMILARRIAEGLEGSAVEVSPESRPLYHLGATLAAGGVVTLIASACELASRLGLDPKISRGYLRLAEGAIKQAAASQTIPEAITGPVARGETEEYLSQLRQLRSIDSELADLVENLARRTRHLLNRTGS